MPAQFFTEAERERLNRFPRQIAPDDLITYFTLSTADLKWVQKQHGRRNRLGCALQLGALRYLGFSPDQLDSAPAEMVSFLAARLKVSPEILVDYAKREQTRTEHFQKVCIYLGFREATTADLSALADWLLEHALEHDKPVVLFHLAADKLRVDKIVRPGVTRLERLIGTVRERTERETYRRVTPLLSKEVCAFLDRVLEVDKDLNGTALEWLRHASRAIGSTPQAINEAIQKLNYLREQGVTSWDLGVINPNRQKFLAQVGRHATNQLLQRANEERRYPILLAFSRSGQALENVTDEIVDLFSNYLAQAYRRAGRELEEFRQSAAKTTNEKLRLFHTVGRLVLNTTIADKKLRPAIYEAVPQTKLQAAVDECAELIRPTDDPYFDFLANRYSVLRSFTPEFLAALEFRANAAHAPLLEGVKVLRELDAEGRRKLPEAAPVGFVSDKWRPYVIDADGKPVRRFYELCVLWELREALRAGNVWVTESRRYANPDTYLIAKPEWAQVRVETCRLMQVLLEGEARLRQLQEQLVKQVAKLEQTLDRNTNVRLEDGRLVITPLSAEDLPQSVRELREQITKRLPRIELSEMLIEVDSWTHFSQHFEHAGGSEPRSRDLQTTLYAVLLAHGCNFGLDTMAQLADFSYSRLAWCSNWYMREETLRAATTAIVNYHYHLPLTRQWGGGTLSSSDGQRFPAAVPTSNATPLPRYFGYGRGLTFYTWTSDQFSQYGTKVIPSTARDATYVLDEILGNETELPIVEHTTDTSGFTEMIFALFDLLGLQFAPRIRDLGDQRLFRFGEEVKQSPLKPLFKGKLRQGLIVPQWDDLLRTAGSLKRGHVTASLLLGKLQVAPRRNELSQALQEYGRAVKTLFILRYADSEEYRWRIEIQLNKGEALHALRRFIFFAHLGQLQKRHKEDQVNQAACLNLVTNAVITWNTVYMAAVIEQLKREGYPIQEADLAHLSPARYDHVNPYGKYQFNVAEVLSRKELRPLRRPDKE